MVRKDFYTKESYKRKQSELTKKQWELGLHDHQRHTISRVCARDGCSNIFQVVPSSPKQYCTHRCAAIIRNTGRTLSRITRSRIKDALVGRTYPERRRRNALRKPQVYYTCLNPECRKRFSVKYWRSKSNPVRYCSRSCVIRTVGKRPTSPKAARAKAGIRPDIDQHIYFFSRWEANYARILNLQGIKWVHQPKRFRLATQWYTPDFFLPSTNTYIEIKNYLSEYSQKRDAGFRALYPREKLILILKDDYKKLERKYAPLIPKWEYST